MADARQAILMVAVLLGLMGALAVPPFMVTGASSGSIARLTPAEAMVGTVRIVATGRWDDPASAYPPRVRSRMPSGIVWWLALAGPVLVGGVVAALLVKPIDVITARRQFGRRAWDPRGFRPRSDFGRPRDVPRLIVKRRSGARMTLGRLERRLLAADREAMVALCGPTGAGKTTRFVVPWVLEAEGPVLVSSTKPDVEMLTSRQRARGGEVWSFDPFGDSSRSNACCWDPLEACEEWGRALRQAKWLADAASDPHASHIAAFWGAEAARLLAPLLHAAALAGESIAQVVAWLDTQNGKDPLSILKSDGDERAHVQLEGIFALDPRNRGTTYMSAGNLLAAYRYPEVEATARPGFSATDLLDGSAATLYISSTSRHQRLVTPLFVALIASVLDAAVDKALSHGGELPFILRALLDETANTAPLQDLHSYLSQMRSYNIRIATTWQDLGQMKERYGESMHTILSASTTKIFMGPVTDQATFDYIAQLLGNVPTDVDGHSTLAPKGAAPDLQQLGRDRALVVAGDMPPVLVRVRHWSLLDEFRTAGTGGRGEASEPGPEGRAGPYESNRVAPRKERSTRPQNRRLPAMRSVDEETSDFTRPVNVSGSEIAPS